MSSPQESYSNGSNIIGSKRTTNNGKGEDNRPQMLMYFAKVWQGGRAPAARERACSLCWRGRGRPEPKWLGCRARNG